MVPTRRTQAYNGRVDRVLRSYHRGKLSLVVNAVGITTLAVGGGSMLVNVLTHVVGG